MKTLTGPVYDIESNHHFQDLQKKIVDLKTLSGPVYRTEREHSYQGMQDSKDTPRELVGPVFNIDRDHHFSEIDKHVVALKDLKGPVYEIDRNHHFNEIEKHVSEVIWARSYPNGLANKIFLTSETAPKKLSEILDEKAWEDTKAIKVKGYFVNNTSTVTIRVQTDDGSEYIHSSSGKWIWAD